MGLVSDDDIRKEQKPLCEATSIKRVNGYASSYSLWLLLVLFLYCSSVASAQVEDHGPGYAVPKGQERTPHECTYRATIYEQIHCLEILLTKEIRSLSDVSVTMCQAESLVMSKFVPQCEVRSLLWSGV
jgi:hypothetical protein